MSLGQSARTSGGPLKSTYKFEEPITDWRSEVSKVSFWALPFLLFASVFSVGMYQCDEHFQILEFISFKMGKSPATDLPWEYTSQVRPWLQPWLYLQMAKFWKLLGIINPFHWALSFRLLGALLTWVVLRQFSYALEVWAPTPKVRRWALLLLWFSFFLPYLAVRTSSENFSGIALCLTLALLARPLTNSRALAVGILLGLAFEFRYQAATAAVGILAWILIQRKARLPQFGLLVVGGLLALLLGFIVDYWGYGVPVFPAVNYFRVNLLEGKAAEFGVEPWYGYVPILWSQMIMPFGLILFVGTMMGWIKAPRSLLTWATIPFVLVHSYIGHKEIRFLFPIYAPALVLSAIGLAELNWHRFLRPVVKILVVVNFVAFLIMTFRPSKNEFEVMRYIYDHQEFPSTPVAFMKENLYHMCGTLNVNFFAPERPVFYNVETGNELLKILSLESPVFLYRTGKDKVELAPELFPYCTLEKEAGIFALAPERVWEWPIVKPVVRRNRYFKLYRCSRYEHG